MHRQHLGVLGRKKRKTIDFTNRSIKKHLNQILTSKLKCVFHFFFSYSPKPSFDGCKKSAWECSSQCDIQQSTKSVNKHSIVFVWLLTTCQASICGFWALHHCSAQMEPNIHSNNTFNFRLFSTLSFHCLPCKHWREAQRQSQTRICSGHGLATHVCLWGLALA